MIMYSADMYYIESLKVQGDQTLHSSNLVCKQLLARFLMGHSASRSMRLKFCSSSGPGLFKKRQHPTEKPWVHSKSMRF